MKHSLPKAILIDLSGTVHVENTLIRGVKQALTKLRAAGFAYKFVTNTSKESSSALRSRLTRLGLDVSANEIFSSLSATHDYLLEKSLRPMLFLEEDAMQDFKDIDTSNPNAVVIGLAPSMFHYDKLTEAFNCLQSGAQLIGLNKSRYFQRETGLSLGPGAFVSALEYSTDKSAKIIGKPSKTFFEKSIESLEDVALEDCVMIGDDVRDDVGGAQCIGMRGILVQTGKYRDGDEMKVSPPPYMVLPSLVDAIDHLVSLKATSA